MRAFASLLLALLFSLLCAPAWAQLRTIPADAKLGTMRHLRDTIVEIDGQRARLSAGAQIRSEANMIVLPTALPPGSLVKYQRDEAGQVHRVWILTPEEAAQPQAQ
ncbi:MAG TPA: hypothetical protein VGI18_12740 [Burkholderiales bacterium]|jgi:hypothetical protein